MRSVQKNPITTQLDLNAVGQALASAGRRPTRTSRGLSFRCICGQHKRDDAKPSAEAWIDPDGRLAVTCWAPLGDNAILRQNILALMGIGREVAPRHPAPTFQIGKPIDDTARRRRAQAIWATSYPIPDECQSPPRLWLDGKCGLWGRVSPAIRWQPDLGPDGRAGYIVCLLATPEAWAEAYPALPEPSAVHRVGITADGRKAPRAFRLGAEHWGDKRTDGPMRGCVLQLGDPSDDHPTIRVAEGIADALAVHCRWQQTTWALCGTAGFSNAAIADALSGADTIIHADAGQAGEKAALTLRDAVQKNGGDARAYAPAEGDDPADALGDIGYSLDDGAETDFGESETVQWREIMASTDGQLLDVPRAVAGHESGKSCGHSHGTNMAKSATFFALPERTIETRCMEPYAVSSNLPRGERHWQPGDCTSCPGCMRWWKVKIRGRLRFAGGGRAILQIPFDTLEEAKAWREKQGKRFSARSCRIINPAETGLILIFIYCGKVTDRQMQNTLRAMDREGLAGTFVREKATEDDLEKILPVTKAIETDSGERVNTVSFSPSMPKLGKKPDDYLYGDPERHDEYLPPEKITDLPVQYHFQQSLSVDHQALLNSADRMARQDLYLEVGEFREWVDMIKAGDIRTVSNLRDELTGEYGGSAQLLFDCANWYADRAEYRWAYGPVLEAVGMLPDHILGMLGVTLPRPPRCPYCGARACAC